MLVVRRQTFYSESARWLFWKHISIYLFIISTFPHWGKENVFVDIEHSARRWLCCKGCIPEIMKQRVIIYDFFGQIFVLLINVYEWLLNCYICTFSTDLKSLSAHKKKALFKCIVVKISMKSNPIFYTTAFTVCIFSATAISYMHTEWLL